MSQLSPADTEAVNRMQQRIAALERLLIAHGIAVPDDASLAGGSSTLGFPELDFSDRLQKEAATVSLRSALEDFEHIARTITELWGKDGFDEYLAKLIVDERGTRKGFSMDAMEELLLLARLARARKALYGMGFDRPPRDAWKELPEAERRSARAPVR
jgi:hypothetical protein